MWSTAGCLYRPCAGEQVTIRRIHEFAEENTELLNFLIEKMVLPGVEVEVLEVLPFNQTLTIGLEGGG